MTPDAVEALIRNGKPADVVSALADLEPDQRKKLSATIKKLRKAVNSGDGTFSGRLTWQQQKQVHDKWRRTNPNIHSNLDLATLACCGASDCRRIEPGWGYQEKRDDQIAEILIKRNPDWLDTWVGQRLSGEWPQISWALVRRLFEAGVIRKPDSDRYVDLFVQAMREYSVKKPDPHTPISSRLLQRPDFLAEDVWRLFECENPAFQTDWVINYPSRPRPTNYETWPDALVKLSSDGHVDRQRLLDCCLAGMRRDFKQNYLGGFAKFHDALKPSTAELQAREPTYLDLLTHPTGSIVTFAVRTLAKLNRAGKLDAESFLSSAAAVFAQPTKSSAVQTLKIAKALADKDSSFLPKAQSLAIAAMSHPNTDVQELALEVVGEVNEADDSLRSQFRRQVANIAPRFQVRAESLLGTTDSGEQTGADPDEESGDLEAEISALPMEIREFVGLAGVMDRSLPPPLRFQSCDIPAAPKREPLEPIQDIDSLLELAAHLVETVDSGDQIEQLLDGIARLGHDRGGNFGRLAAPLQQRLEKGQGTSSYGLGMFWSGLPLAMADLLFTWLTGQRYHSPNNEWYVSNPVSEFSIVRLREVREIVVGGKPQQLLATPTHRGGWLDPQVFVARIQEHLSTGQSVYRADLMQAMLRLTPDGRADALRAADRLKGDEGRLCRFALGGNDAPTKRDRKIAGLWVCAARTRDPIGPLTEPLAPIAQKIPNLPDHLMPPNYEWRIETTRNQGHEFKKLVFDGMTEYDTRPNKKESIGKRLASKLKPEIQFAEWPLGAMHMRPQYYGYLLTDSIAPWRIEWLATQWPTNLESYYQYAALFLHQRFNDNTSRDAPAHFFLSPLFEPTRSWGDMAHLALCIGLTSKSADARGFAIDALISGIESGHADIETTAAVMSKLLDEGVLKLNRLPAAFEPVFSVSDLHCWWVGALVTRTLARVPELPKNAHFLFDIALQCLTKLKMRSPESISVLLQGLKGSSKVAKLARELLQLEGASVDEPPEPVIAQARRGRVELAKTFAPESLQQTLEARNAQAGPRHGGSPLQSTPP